MILEREKIEEIKEESFLDYLSLAIFKIPEYSRGYCKVRDILKSEGAEALNDIALGKYDGLF